MLHQLSLRTVFFYLAVRQKQKKLKMLKLAGWNNATDKHLSPFFPPLVKRRWSIWQESSTTLPHATNQSQASVVDLWLIWESQLWNHFRSFIFLNKAEKALFKSVNVSSWPFHAKSIVSRRTSSWAWMLVKKGPLSNLVIAAKFKCLRFFFFFFKQASGAVKLAFERYVPLFFFFNEFS